MALGYYAAFPDEITPHIKTEEEALADLHRALGGDSSDEPELARGGVAVQ